MNQTKPNETTEQKKLTYEELAGACKDLYQQNMELRQRLQQADMVIKNISRLDYLFKVLDHADIIKDPEFINEVVDEIRDAIVVKEVPEENNEKK